MIELGKTSVEVKIETKGYQSSLNHKITINVEDITTLDEIEELLHTIVKSLGHNYIEEVKCFKKGEIIE